MGRVPGFEIAGYARSLLEAFASCLGRFAEALGAAGAGTVAIDGKTLRRSFDRAASRSALHVVAAFGADARVVPGQKAARAGGEIAAARALLETPALDGALVTGDAPRCQGETARTVLERGGDYLFAPEANRPGMPVEVAAYFADPPAPLARHETVDGAHGRIETRRHWVCHDVGWLFSSRRYPGEPAMPGLAAIACVERARERDGETARATRYDLCSAPISAERFAEAVRAHWNIENGLHWVLDTAFDEDRARNRKDNGPENLATPRELALDMLRTARPDISIRRKRPRAGNSDAFARSIVGQMR